VLHVSILKPGIHLRRRSTSRRSPRHVQPTKYCFAAQSPTPTTTTPLAICSTQRARPGRRGPRLKPWLTLVQNRCKGKGKSNRRSLRDDNKKGKDDDKNKSKGKGKWRRRKVEETLTVEGNLDASVSFFGLPFFADGSQGFRGRGGFRWRR